MDANCLVALEVDLLEAVEKGEFQLSDELIVYGSCLEVIRLSKA